MNFQPFKNLSPFSSSFQEMSLPVLWTMRVFALFAFYCNSFSCSRKEPYFKSLPALSRLRLSLLLLIHLSPFSTQQKCLERGLTEGFLIWPVRLIPLVIRDILSYEILHKTLYFPLSLPPCTLTTNKYQQPSANLFQLIDSALACFLGVDQFSSQIFKCSENPIHFHSI